jgi:hypothetical protein
VLRALRAKANRPIGRVMRAEFMIVVIPRRVVA